MNSNEINDDNNSFIKKKKKGIYLKKINENISINNNNYNQEISEYDNTFISDVYLFDNKNDESLPKKRKIEEINVSPDTFKFENDKTKKNQIKSNIPIILNNIKNNMNNNKYKDLSFIGAEYDQIIKMIKDIVTYMLAKYNINDKDANILSNAIYNTLK
jgi:hypothetical protein